MAPDAELEAAYAGLLPGIDTAASELLPGVVTTAMPTASSLQAWAFGERWLALNLPRHLTHIPAQTLIERLIAAGLRDDRESYWRGGQVPFGWLHGLVGSLPRRPRPLRGAA